MLMLSCLILKETLKATCVFEPLLGFQPQLRDGTLDNKMTNDQLPTTQRLFNIMC